jgi:hypothetical protein
MEMNELYPTYAENIRIAAKMAGLDIRQISTRTGYCYEHIRKIWMGRTPKRKDQKLTISRDCNDDLCELLGLPADEMFKLAEQEKYAQRNGYAPIQLVDPIGQELSDLWNELDESQRVVMLRMAHSFATERQVVAS